MTRIFSILTALALSLTMSAQSTIDEWSAAVQKFGRSIPQEKVFLHTDNQCYFLGDTIHYRAYLTRSDRRTPSNVSGLLYVELLNADGYLIERQNVPIKYGMGTGTIVLDTATCLYAGYYEMRAYTRWQLNWGQTTYPHTEWSEKWFYNKAMASEYYRDYEKLYSRIIPIYDFPAERGDYARDMTVRPMQRLFKGEDKSGRTTISLFPEGGNLLCGTPNRVAFEATSAEGRHLRGTLRIADGAHTVAEAHTEHRGRGTITFTPAGGAHYTCTFVTEAETHKVKLPDITTQGVDLQADITDKELHINATPMGIAADEELGLTIMCGGLVERTINLSREGMKHSLPLADLPLGVLDITIFNDQGRVYADRLVFNHASADALQSHTIAIGGADAHTEAYKPLTLTLSSAQGKAGIVSVSVMDAATTEETQDNGTLLTEMLLSSEIRGFVEDPLYYFESQDEAHRRHLDLLMMVQGWRRFDWHTMAAPKEYGFELLHPNEMRSSIMTGTVNRYRAENTADVYRQEALKAVEEYMEKSVDELAEPQTEMEEEESTVANGTDDDQLRQSRYGELVQEAENAYERFEQSYGNLKREVAVHAEFSQPGSEPLLGDVTTERGRFKIEAPIFDGECYFFLAASDTTHWGQKGHQWVQVNHENIDKREFPEFYVKLDHPFPRFAHPYTFYQTAPAEPRATTQMKPVSLYDDNLLPEVTIRVKRSGLRAFDRKHPALVIDALQAHNYAIDAGLCTGQFLGSNRFANDIARAYIGDMGLERQYTLQTRYDNLRPGNDMQTGSNMSEGKLNSYNDIARLDKVKIYTDFSPRNIGDSRWRGSDQPIVIVNLIKMPNDGMRITYRDRRLILTGYSICEDFYHPDYSTMALPSQPDVRRTLYWNPTLRLDEQGKATVTLYRNARPGQVVVTINGFSADGNVICGEAR